VKQRIRAMLGLKRFCGIDHPVQAAPADVATQPLEENWLQKTHAEECVTF
jgi:hypothetical protein